MCCSRRAFPLELKLKVALKSVKWAHRYFLERVYFHSCTVAAGKLENFWQLRRFRTSRYVTGRRSKASLWAMETYFTAVFILDGLKSMTKYINNRRRRTRKGGSLYSLRVRNTEVPLKRHLRRRHFEAFRANRNTWCSISVDLKRTTCLNGELSNISFCLPLILSGSK